MSSTSRISEYWDVILSDAKTVRHTTKCSIFSFPIEIRTTEPEDPLDNTARSKISINSGSVEQKCSFYTDLTNKSRQHDSKELINKGSSFLESSDFYLTYVWKIRINGETEESSISQSLVIY